MIRPKCYRLGSELVVTNYREEVIGYVEMTLHGPVMFHAFDGYRNPVGLFPTESAAVESLVAMANAAGR